jgi:dephospho-CoA kinase
MKVAITGGIATGKSTVLAKLAELGHSIVSADEIAREIFVETETQRELSSLTGLNVPISSAELRDRLVETPGVRQEVNRLFHQRVMDAILRSDAEFCEVPLLIEVCGQKFFDSVWVVTCTPESQRSRLQARYGDEVDIDAILATQLPMMVKEAFADRIIRTDEPSEPVWALLSSFVPSAGRI